MQREFAVIEEEEDTHLFNRKKKTRVNPLSLLLNCTTEPSIMRKEALYIDTQRRLYRPRVTLTEDANQLYTREEASERFIFFDVYVQPKVSEKKLDALLKKQSREEKEKALRGGELLEQKSRPPEGGELLRLSIRQKIPKGDHDTVREFECRVVDIYWGSLSLIGPDGLEEMRPNQNCGLVKTEVVGIHQRSLVVNDPQTIRRNRYTIPL